MIFQERINVLLYVTFNLKCLDVSFTCKVLIYKADLFTSNPFSKRGLYLQPATPE